MSGPDTSGTDAVSASVQSMSSTDLPAGPLQQAVSAVGQVGLLLSVGLLLLSALLAATGHDVGPALSALVRGAFGSWYAITSATIVRMVPLGFAGLAVALAFRAGVLNVGAEGQLLMGAATATALALPLQHASPWLAIPVMIVGGAMAGGLWAMVAGVLRLRFGVLEVISTIMLNFVALNLVGWLVRGPLQEPQRINPQSVSLPTSLQLPVLIESTRLHAGVLLLLVTAAALAWWLFNTAGGFRVRAVGANPRAAHSAGEIAVGPTLLLAFVLSGLLAGMGGAVEYLGVTYALYENFSPGYGYTAIAVALLARLHPIGVLGTALLFGALEAGANAMQRDAGVPSAVVTVVEAVLILLVVALDRWRARAASGRIST
jgi:simple sugar transport system permease protein